MEVAAILNLAAILDGEFKNGMTAYIDVLCMQIVMYDLIIFAFHSK